MSKIPLIIAASLPILICNISMADTIVLPIHSQGDYLGEIELPGKGRKQQQVINSFGAPTVQHAAAGEPAISRWDYLDFSVYFENDTVIHSVLKHRRQDSAETAK
ncbi:MAG: hypothetical protein ACJAYG_001619 [Oceanicoccus sp.]|jgi:hypothetical protein